MLARDMESTGLVFLSVVALGVDLIFLIRPIWWIFVERILNHTILKHSFNTAFFYLTLIMVFLFLWTTNLLGVLILSFVRFCLD